VVHFEDEERLERGATWAYITTDNPAQATLDRRK
jgi:hypothetical protein